MKTQNLAVISAYKRQQGMTLISTILIIVMVGFIGLIGLRLFPVYLENFKVSSHLQQLASDANTGKLSDSEIVQALSKRFSIDDVTNVKPENIFVEREAGAINIAVEYEVRTAGIANVEMVASFIEEVTVN